MESVKRLNAHRGLLQLYDGILRPLSNSVLLYCVVVQTQHVVLERLCFDRSFCMVVIALLGVQLIVLLQDYSHCNMWYNMKILINEVK